MFIALAVLGAVGARLVGVASAAPTPPAIGACVYFPDPRSNVSVACGTTNTVLPGFLGAPIRFNMSVSDAEGDNVTATFYFDYRTVINGTPVVNPDSPVRNVTVDTPGGAGTAYLEVEWTYYVHSNFSTGLNASRYFVRVEVRDEWGEYNSTSGWRETRVIVKENQGPYVSGLPSLVSVSPTIRPQNPVVPLAYLNASAGDWDADPLRVSWDWGDGTWNVSELPPSPTSLPLNVTHLYMPASFPLNESPRDVRFDVTVWIDDGVGHNVSGSSVVEFSIDLDFAPTVAIRSPLPGERWKVNEPVLLDATAQDREGDPVLFFWDFDNRTDADADGDPTNDRDATTNRTFHAYAAVDDYNVTFWATDGENKKLCTSLDRLCTTYRTHWVAQTIPFLVRTNEAPILAHSNQTAVAGLPTAFRAVALDADGDSMNVTWIWGDGSGNSTNVTVGTRGVAETLELFQDHTYEEAGIYNLTLIVSDGTDEVQETKEVFVESFNEPPLLFDIKAYRENGTLASNSTFLPGDVVRINVTMGDLEGDPLRLEVDWGDGNVTTAVISDSTQNCTKTADNRTDCAFTHVYADTGEALHNYQVLVTITDDKVWFQRNVTVENGTIIVGPPIVRPHTKNLSLVVIIAVPRAPGGLGPWDWVDYSMLSIAMGLPIALIGRWFWRARKERKEE